jgi:hypothetical protein
MATCPNNHESRTNDFCSVCGIEMSATTEVAPVTEPEIVAGVTETCPICQTPRSGDRGDFCEECGYNFKTGSLAAVPVAPEPESPKPRPDGGTKAESAVIAAAPPATQPKRTESEPVAPATEEALQPEPPKQRPAWEAIVSVDPAIRGTPIAEAPAGQPERLYPLDGDKLIGRKSVGRNIAPDIDLSNDTAVSHQQAKLALQSSGEIALVDLGSSNGTLLNTTIIPSNVLHLLKDGDVIGMGSWTKIIIRKTPN